MDHFKTLLSLENLNAGPFKILMPILLRCRREAFKQHLHLKKMFSWSVYMICTAYHTHIVLTMVYVSFFFLAQCPLETVQDFLIKLGIKPLMYLSIGNKHFFTK